MGRPLCVVLVLMAMAVVPAGARAAADPLAVKGGRLVDGQGRTVVLHGVNVVYKLAPYAPDFTRADARRLRGWGMNAIRLGVTSAAAWLPIRPDPWLAFPRGFDVHAVRARVVRRAPLTLRGAGRASITLTRR